MKIKVKIVAFSTVLFLFAGIQQGTVKVKNDIVHTCSSGDLSFLNPYLKGFVVLRMAGNDGLTSAERCRSLLRDFFLKNVPEKFEVLETGMTGQNFFIIGTLHSNNKKKWNTYFLLMSQDGQYQLQQIDIQRMPID